MECYYFGTFNPPHIGHIKIAKEVMKLFSFTSVIFVPSCNPPHKNCATDSIHRLKMLKLLEDKNIKVSDIEFRLPKPSYSYRTIEEILKTKKENEKLNFIIGYDAFKMIESWKNPEILKDKLHFIVLKRKGDKREDIEKLAKKGFDFIICDGIEEINVSSTEIREKIKQGSSITGLVDERVKRYIDEYGLYRTNS